MAVKRPAARTEHIIDRLLVVGADQAAAAQKLLEVGEADPEQIAVYLSNLDANEAEAIGGMLGFLDVDNPHQAAEALAESGTGIIGSPVHAVGYESHAGFMAGPGPGRSEQSIDPVNHGHSDQIIAVIDSGLSSTRPSWMAGTNVWHDFIDHEQVADGGASHGTFVTSVLRQIAPDYVVSLAASKPAASGVLKAPNEKHFDKQMPTTELDVLGAMIRLVNRHKSDPWKVKALNLSLGAVTCSHHDPFYVTLAVAIDLWRDHMGRNAPVFAAGGNGTDGAPVFPGAFECVRAVGAGARGGHQKVWDSRGKESTDNRRDWITDVAPGVKVVGLSGYDKSQTVWWSGSSFATAIATASSVSGARFEVDAGVTYWHDRSLSLASHSVRFE